MSTKSIIQKVRAEVEAHEDRGWLKGYEEGLAKREEQIVEAQAALEVRNARIRELSHQKKGPTSAREALDLAWELAYPIKEGQTIPVGTRYVQRSENGGLTTFTATEGWTLTPRYAGHLRTLEPLPEPEPEPDWLDAPAVIAHTDNDHARRVWTARNDDQWASTSHTYTRHWTSLRDVTPLYPKGQEA